MDTITVALIIVITVFTWFYIRKKTNRIETLINEIPGPKSYPLVGTSLPFLLKKKDVFFRYGRGLVKTHGPIFRLWFGSNASVAISDPKYIELVLGNTTHISKGFVYKFVWPWLGDGLLTSTGEKWHRHRKLLTPTFHFKILETFMDVFVEKSELLVKMLEEKANGKPFNIFPHITLCALDIICATAMGIQVNAMSSKNSKYIDAIYGICEEVVHRFTRVWLREDWLYYKTEAGKKFLKYLSILHDTTYKIINERKRALAERQVLKQDKVSENNFGEKSRKAFLDLLLELAKNGSVLTDEQIREEVDTFLFEGHDTTTASISWTIFLLGLHPVIQEEAYKEVSQVLQDNQPLTLANLNDLKYLERIIKESLRLYPSVGSISRLVSQDIKMDKYTVPTGSYVSILIYDVHRNPEYFKEPDKFDPDRFLPENSKERHPFAYIPFSAGPRNCIGQKFALYEEKTVLSYIIKNFKIKSLQTVDNVKPVNDLILRPLDGIDVILEKRK